MRMHLSDYTYDLPEELIAQQPAEVRDRSRMMVLHRNAGEIEVRTFRDLPEYFGEGDLFVVNDSRVFPARLVGRKETGGLIEILLLRRSPGGLRKKPGRCCFVPANGSASGCRLFLRKVAGRG